VEISEEDAEAGVGNLSTKPWSSATIARNQGIFNINILVGRKV
jgi:hypothetical protein